MVKRHLRLMLSMFLVSKRMVEQNNNIVKTGMKLSCLDVLWLTMITMVAR